MAIPSLFTCSSVDGHVGCFHLLTIINNTAINIHVHVSVSTYVFISLRYIPRSRITGSNGNSDFNCFRTCHPTFQSVSPFYITMSSVRGL